MSPQIAAAPRLPKMELIPPAGADVDGVFKEAGSPLDGRIIYTETVVDVDATKASAKIKLDAQGNRLEELCVHPGPWMPHADNMLLQKVSLEVDEDEMRMVANITDQRSGRLISPSMRAS